jgi:hypothetical protein
MRKIEVQRRELTQPLIFFCYALPLKVKGNSIHEGVSTTYLTTHQELKSHPQISSDPIPEHPILNHTHQLKLNHLCAQNLNEKIKNNKH